MNARLLALVLPAVLFSFPDAQASPTVSNGQLVWPLPTGTYREAGLRYRTPDGQVHERSFPAGTPPALPLKGLPDGGISFELSYAPVTAAGAAAPGDGRSAGSMITTPPPAPETGHFVMSGGAPILPGQEQEPARAGGNRATLRDAVTADDVIIQGSLCVGFDCVNGESFGFDTVRLKENNLRIRFQDTSATAGFPNNVWQLTANDSTSGGLNQFSIEDITNSRVPFLVEAGAPTHALYVDGSGRIGVGTSTPAMALHARKGDTPGVRLEQDTSGGFTAQTWDVAGNEANFFVRDLTGGSRLPLRIRPGAPTSSIDIAASGNVGLGTASPAAALHLTRADGSAGVLVEETSPASAARTLMQLTNNGTTQLTMTDSSAAARQWLLKAGSDFAIGNAAVDGIRIDAGGNVTVGGTLSQLSSRLYKENLVTPDGRQLLARLAALPIYRWNYTRTGPGEQHLGPVAEDFYASFGLGEDDRHVAPGDMAGVALAAVKALQQSVKEKDQRIAELEARLARIEAALSERTK